MNHKISNILIVVVGIMLVIMAFTCFSVIARGQDNVIKNCLVYKVIDGDTIRCSVGDEKYYVRFIGADTPEITWGKNECYGQEGKQYLVDNIYGKYVNLTFEGGKTYGRVVAWVSDDKNLYNLNLVLFGYARQTTERFPTKLYPSSLFIQSELVARYNSFGGWGSSCSSEFISWYYKKQFSDREKIQKGVSK